MSGDGDLGWRSADGKIANDGMNPYGDGNWVVEFTPAIFAVSTNKFQIYHIALKGPLGSTFQVYTDRTFYDISNHGDVNSWDPNFPMKLDGGKTLYFYYNLSIAPAPMITVWMREPPIIQ